MSCNKASSELSENELIADIIVQEECVDVGMRMSLIL